MDLTNIKMYDSYSANSEDEIIETNISLSNIVDIVNNVLNKHNEICYYLIHLNDNYWSVNFKVSKVNSLETLIMTSFQINLFKDMNHNSVIVLSKEIKKFDEWNQILADLLRNLKTKKN